MDFVLLLAALTPEVFSAQATAWITAVMQIFVPLSALAAVVFAFVSMLRSKATQLHTAVIEQRVDRQANRTESLQNQITSVAIATPGLAGNGNGHVAPVEVEVVNTAKSPVPIIES